MASSPHLRFGRAMCVLALLAAAAPSLRAQTLSGVVFDDRNGDGTRQAGEAGLGGVVVSNQVDVVQTKPDGSYELSGSGYGVAFVSAPRGRAAVGSFWRSVAAGGSPRVDFPLATAADAD